MDDIPFKVIKMHKDLFANFITDHFNYRIAYSQFPDELKHVGVIPVHKKNESFDKTEYKPLNFLTNISNNFEKLMFNKLAKYFDGLLVTN